MLPSALVLLLLSGGTAPSAFDASPPNAATVAARAEKICAQMLAALPPVNRTKIETELKQWAATPDSGAPERVRSATFLVIGYDELALLYGADAVRRDPNDGVSAANFGALLFLKEGTAAIDVLLYARGLAPQSAEVVSTLGHAALASDDLVRAQKYFDEALRLDAEHGEALLGLAAVALRRGDEKAAFGYLARAGRVTVHREAERIPPPQDSEGNRQPPPAPIETPPPPKGTPWDEEETSAHPTGVDVEFPPSPNWADPDAFVSALKAREHVASWYSDEMNKKLAHLSAVAGRQASKPRDPDQPWVTSPDRQASMERNDDWLQAELRKALKSYDQTVKAQLDALTKEQPQLPGAMVTKEAAAAIIRKNCLDAHSRVTSMWLVVKPAQLQLFTDVNAALKRYYRAQAGWIRLIDDRDAWEIAVDHRDIVVLSAYLSLLMSESGLQLGLGLAIAAGGTGSINQCPGGAPPAPASPPEDPKKPELAAPKFSPCPFDKHPLDLSAKVPYVDFLSVGAKLHCSSVEVNVAGGPFSASKKRVFHQRTEVHYQAQVDKTLSGPAGAKLSATATGTVDIVRNDDGSETVMTGIKGELEGRIPMVAEAKIEASATSMFSAKKATGGAKRAP